MSSKTGSLSDSSICVSEVINSLKDAFREAFREDIDSGSLHSVFLIGSKSTAEPPYVAGDTSQLEGNYQDFDVHFLTDRTVFEPAELTSIRDRVDAICAAAAKPGVNVGWGVRDRHWKLVPDPDYEINVCVHVVICNRFDYQCRAIFQPVLGSNMYRICEPLAGSHPGQLLPTIRPTVAELVYSSGGAGWMLEQFHRALLLHYWEPNEQDFMPFLSSYSWNVVSSIMLELYSASTGKVITRRGALRWLIGLPELPQEISKQVQMLDAFKETPSVEDDLGHSLVNASFKTSHWMLEKLHSLAGIPLPKLPRQGMFKQRDLYSNAMAAAFDKPVRLTEAHFGFEPGEDPYGSLLQLADTIRRSYLNASPCELPEFIAWAARRQPDEATKVSIWSPFNFARYQLSDDFAFSRQRPNLWAAQWGWESGTQGLLQRFHERYTNRFTLLRNREQSPDVEAELRTARAYAILAREQFDELGVSTEPAQGNGLFDQAQYLSDLTEPSSMCWPDLEIGA